MLFGPDVSNYQANIDMARVRAEGFDFVCAKATQGSSYRSPSYPRQRDSAIRAGLIFYAYHYVDTSDPAAQARNFAGHAGAGIACMLDWEANGGNGAWLRTVAAAFRRAGIRLAPTYGPKWYWQQVGSPDLRPVGGALVASSYPSTKSGAASALYQNVGANRWASYGGLPVAILQFTDRALIAGLQIDCNAYPGSREQLISLLYGGGDPAGPPPTRRRRYREAANEMRDKITPAFKPDPANPNGPWVLDLDHIADGRFTGPFGGPSATIEAGWVTCSNNGSMELEFWCERSVNGAKTGMPNAHYTWTVGPGDAPSFRIPDGASWVYYQARKITGSGDVAIDIRPRP